ncbi:hypothetical protein Pla52o_27940 [Novipirellula galeiformis]|uniref:EF-hand domain-containing protein n=1 Tax=Novipirellula galeiformis TaxID=2528004 RepID=A0A5C6CG28_9BACT|nr:EF-hand domain-containing protein [Novipirellula galeiformis]TWU23258.1 hypothetical protein Pla52o_27940 [Novipirellula galeiformis]
MMRPIALSLFAITIALPSIVMAQPPGGGRGPGGGSPLERMSQIFDMADANGDGQLSKAELTAAMNTPLGGNQRGGGPQGRGGPPPGLDNGQGPMQRGPGEHGRPGGPGGQDGQGGHGGPGGPPPRPGQVLPDFVAQSLNLTERQQRQLAALQADVDKRLAGLLTDEQQQQLQNPPPRPGHGEGGPGHERPGQNRDNGRPQRPQ